MVTFGLLRFTFSASYCGRNHVWVMDVLRCVQLEGMSIGSSISQMDPKRRLDQAGCLDPIIINQYGVGRGEPCPDLVRLVGA